MITLKVAEDAIFFLAEETKKLTQKNYFFAVIVNEKGKLLHSYCPQNCSLGCCDIGRALNSAIHALRFSPEEGGGGRTVWKNKKKIGAIAIIGLGPEANKTLTTKTRQFLETA